MSSTSRDSIRELFNTEERNISPSGSKKSKEGKEKTLSTWELIRDVWPKEMRPPTLQDKEKVNRLSVDTIRSLHKLHKETEKARKGENHETMTRDQKPRSREYQRQKDDRDKRLHDASWERLPISDPESWYPKTPTSRSQIYRNMQLEFTGSDGCVADNILVSMHDRTMPLKLKNFLTENANVGSRPHREVKKWEDGELSTVVDFAWDNPASLQGIQEAYINYMCIMGNLWPFDETAHSMLRLMTRYRWAASAPELKTRAKILTDFFEKVLRMNASKAANKTRVLSYAEQEKCLKDILLKNNTRAEIPISDFAGKFEAHGNQSSQGRKNTPKASNGQTRKFQVNGKQACYAYNQSTCNNTPSPRDRNNPYIGCKDHMGREFLHLCNAWIQSRGEFCKGKHPRSNHKY